MSQLNVTSGPSTNQLASIAHTSLYQQWKFFPTQPLAEQANKSKSTRPCPGCGSQSHDQCGSNDCPTKCPAWGKFCNHCKIPHHFASVCQRKPSESASALITQIYYDSQSDACHTISLIQDINEIPALICSTKSNHCNCNPVLINIFPDSGASIWTTSSSTIEFKMRRPYLLSQGSQSSRGLLWTLLLANILQAKKYIFATK